MKKSHVDVVFDRKKRVAKCGKGLAEYRLYLARGVRKYIPITKIRDIRVIRCEKQFSRGVIKTTNYTNS